MAVFGNFTQNGAYVAADHRFTLAALLARDTNGKVVNGILPHTLLDGLVSPAVSPNKTVTINPFAAVATDGARGAYVGGSDSTQVLNIMEPETTNNRRDLLVWRPLESTSTTSTGASTLSQVTLAGTSTAVSKQTINSEVYWIKGTPSSSTSPPTPSVPAGSVALARVHVAGSTTTITAANIKDMRTWTPLLENPKQIFQGTFSGQIGNGTAWGMQGLAANDTATINSPVTISGQNLVINTTGWYNVSLRYQHTVADATAGHVALDFGGADSWGSNLAGGPRANVAVTSYYLTAGQVIKGQFVQISGAPRDFFGAITVQKVA